MDGIHRVYMFNAVARKIVSSTRKTANVQIMHAIGVNTYLEWVRGQPW